jgi:hypothetical protein
MAHVDHSKLSALYTLHDGLARHSENAHRLKHRYITWRHARHNQLFQFICHTNTPGSSGRDLFAADKSIVEPPQQSRGRNAQLLGGGIDREQLALHRLGRRLIARDFPVGTKTGNTIGGEAFTVGRFPSLSIEHAGNDGVRMMDG